VETKLEPGINQIFHRRGIMSKVFEDEVKKQKIHSIKGGYKPVVKEPWEMSVEFHNDDARVLEKKLKPLKAKDITADYDIGKNLNAIKYPALGTPKIEGVRCLTLGDGVAVDGDLKKIPNLHIYNTLLEYGMGGLDGGITIPGATEEEIYAAVMDKNTTENFKYMVFDVWNRPLHKYSDRVKALEFVLAKPRPSMIEIVKPVEITASGGVMEYYKYCASKGFDGVIIRESNGVYTFSDDEVGNTHKLKLYQVGEAEVVGTKEDTKVPNTLKAFVCRDFEFGYTFEVSRGITKEQRKQFWKLKAQYTGGKIFYKTHAALRTKPSNPSFVRIEV